MAILNAHLTKPKRAGAEISKAVWQRYSVGSDSRLEDELVSQYLPLVKTVVGRLALTLPAHLDLEELLSVGAIGLVHAIRHFDAQRGTSFETYARFRIRGAVLDELRRSDWASRSIRDKSRKIQTTMLKLEQRYGSAVTEEQMAVELKLPLGEYQELLERVKPATFVCLDSTSSQSVDDDRDLAEVVCDPNQYSPSDTLERQELIELITDRIKTLPENQRKVLALYYVEDLRLREIAEAFGLTESRICQLHAQAILNIRAFLARNGSYEDAITLEQK